MNPVDTVKQELAPLFRQLLEVLDAEGNENAACGFGDMAALLEAARSEHDIQELFARHLGAALLAQLLPSLIDKLTPNGQITQPLDLLEAGLNFLQRQLR